MAEQTIPGTRREETRWLWVLIALAGHTGWGSYPVLARYLQTISDLPSMALLSLGSGLVLLVFAPFMWQHLDRSLVRSRLLWLLVLFVVGRSITNLLAARFTLAIYVQLVTLSVPFLVVLLGRLFFSEPIPRYTLHAITFSLTGSLLMLSSSSDVLHLWKIPLAPADWLGIGLALLSSICLATYMLLVRRSASHQLRGDVVLLVQLLANFSVATTASLLLGEDWSRWTTTGPMDWLVFALFAFGVLLGSNLGQIMALRHLGAPFVSSMLGWRLVSVLVMAALLLGERLTTIWQFVGALIVLVTITWYVRQQRG
jgi:drug/metabolite transporter (DMT)-like permease